LGLRYRLPKSIVARRLGFDVCDDGGPWMRVGDGGADEERGIGARRDFVEIGPEIIEISRAKFKNGQIFVRV